MPASPMDAARRRTNQLTIAAVIVVVCVLGGIAAVVFMSVLEEDSVEYNYTVETVDSFINDYGYTEEPAAGMQWVILTYHVYNTEYDDTVDTSLYTWDFSIAYKGILYEHSYETYSHPGYQDVTILPGGDARSVQVFEVPKDATVDDIKVKLKVFSFGWDAQRNKDLAV
jgi:hypothetical protein